MRLRENEQRNITLDSICISSFILIHTLKTSTFTDSANMLSLFVMHISISDPQDLTLLILPICNCCLTNEILLIINFQVLKLESGETARFPCQVNVQKRFFLIKFVSNLCARFSSTLQDGRWHQKIVHQLLTNTLKKYLDLYECRHCPNINELFDGVLFDTSIFAVIIVYL